MKLKFNASKALVSASVLTPNEATALSYLCSAGTSDTVPGISMRTNVVEQKLRLALLCLEDAGLVRREGQFYAPTSDSIVALYSSRRTMLQRSESERSAVSILHSRLGTLLERSSATIEKIGGLEDAIKSKTELSKAEKAAAASINRLDNEKEFSGMNQKKMRKLYSSAMRDVRAGYTDDAILLKGVRQELICAVNMLNSMTLECVVADDASMSRLRHSDIVLLRDGIKSFKDVVVKSGLKNDTRILEALYGSNLRNISILDSEALVVLDSEAGKGVMVFNKEESGEFLVPVNPSSIEAAVIRRSSSNVIDELMS